MTPYVQDSDFTLLVGDVRDCLRELPDESVHTVVTSPPYFNLRDYGVPGQIGLEASLPEFVDAMVVVFREVRRVLRSDGSLWLNLGDSYAGSWGAQGHKGQMADRSVVSARQIEAHPDHQSRTGSLDKYDGAKAKDLLGVPWRVAFALQADGWYLRSDIIWSKPNPMPESVTDRPTKAHEYVFLLTKSPRYFFDQEAVREKAEWARWGDQTNRKHEGSGSAAGWLGDKSKAQLQGGRQARRYSAEEFKTTDERNTRFQGPSPADGGRNVRSVWEIATQPYPDAHFATFPEALPERCIKAGTSERGCCPECGAAWERVVERRPNPAGIAGGEHREVGRSGGIANGRPRDYEAERSIGSSETLGWSPSCSCSTAYVASAQSGHSPSQPSPNSEYDLPHVRHLSTAETLQPVPCTVLDPFMGSGTTALVARRLGRRSVGIELNESYAALCARRLSQLSLLADAHG